jgi:uncharacterized protein involved in exopolysaccharide biosynthesis
MSMSALLGEQQRRGSLSLVPLLTAIFHAWRPIVIVFCLTLTVGMFFVARDRPRYESDASLLVLIGAEYAFRPELAGIPSGDFVFSRNQIVKAELDILGSRQLHETLVRDLGPTTLYPDLEGLAMADQVAAAATRFASDLRVSSPDDTSLLKIAFRHDDAGVAQLATSRLIQAYLERRRTIFSKTTSPILAQQRDRAGERLEDLTRALDHFRRDRGMIDPDEQVFLATRRRNLVDAELARSRELFAQQVQIARRLGEGERRTSGSAVLSRDAVRLPEADNRAAVTLQLRLRRAELDRRFARPNTEMTDLENQIRTVDRYLETVPLRRENTVRRGRSPIADDIAARAALAQVELPGAGARRAEILRQQGAAQAEVDRVVQLAGEFRSLERDRRLALEEFVKLRKRYEEALVTEELRRSTRTTVRVIQPPEQPIVGVSLRFRILVASLIVGLMGAIAVVVLQASLRQGFLDPEHVEKRMGVPVLVAVADKTPRKANYLPPLWLIVALASLTAWVFFERAAQRMFADEAPAATEAPRTPLPIPPSRVSPPTPSVPPVAAPASQVSRPPPAPAPVEVGGGPWVVRVAMLRSPSEASMTADRLRRRGHAVEVVGVADEEVVWQAVQLGPFATRAAAVDAQRAMLTAENLSARIVDLAREGGR